MGQALVDLYCTSFRQAPEQIVLDVDDTFDAVHGGQLLRLFNARHDEYGFQPIVVFDGEGRIVTALLRLAKRSKGTEISAFLRRLLRAIRPITTTAAPRSSTFAARTASTLRRHVEMLEASTTARYEAETKTGKVRRFRDFLGCAASWSWVERIIARVEVGDQGADTRFITSNLEGGRAKATANQFHLFLQPQTPSR